MSFPLQQLLDLYLVPLAFELLLIAFKPLLSRDGVLYLLSP
jgi:hypothetical protein